MLTTLSTKVDLSFNKNTKRDEQTFVSIDGNNETIAL